MKFKKIVWLTVISVLAFSSFQITGLRSVYALSKADVSVTPNVISQYGEYNINFVTSATLSANSDMISIYFPVSTVLPCGCSGVGWKPQDFIINGITLNSTPGGSNADNIIIITVPITIGAGSQVSIKIKSTALIKNPPDAGYYTLKIKTTKETTLVESNQYYIGYSTISNVNMYLDNTVQGTPTSFRIRFNTGILGALNKNFSKIYVDLPYFKLPPFLNGNFVYVNGVSLSQSNLIGVTVNGEELTIPVPVNIDANSPVEIYFSDRANIINPNSPGKYKIRVYTSEETTPIESQDFLVTPTPSVSTNVIVLPYADPTGRNEYYTLPISVILIGSSNTGAVVTTHYSVDGGEFVTVVSQPARIELTDGIHIIKFYSEDSAGAKEEIIQKEFKVDTVIPSIVLTDPQENVIISKFNYTVKGQIDGFDSNTKLYINGKEIVVDSSGKFSYNVSLVEGDNPINLVAEDAAGNKSERNLVIKVTTVTPKLTIFQPVDWQVVHDNSVTVTGSVDIDSSVYVNGQQVNIGEDGYFSYVLSLEGFLKGPIPIKITATSKESNISASKVIIITYDPKPTEILIKLTIGSKDAMVNDKIVTLDVPPFIDAKTNRTLVPIRFISEAFGADVQWDDFSKTVTVTINDKIVKLQVGNNQATVDGNTVSLDQSPVIIDARTFVPIRFISEAFGAEVNWDGTTKTVTITYKP